MLRHDLGASDVGLDALIEDVIDGAATGFFVAVQLKTGRSYLRKRSCRVAADRAHRVYWAQCVLPVIVVVVDPETEDAWWTSLSGWSGAGDTAIEFPREAATAFDHQSLRNVVMPSFRRASPAAHSAGERWRARATEVVASVESSGKRARGRMSRLRAWTELIEIFLAPSSTDDLRANAGYRLAWYEPTVSTAQKRELHAALRGATDADIRRMLDAVAFLVVRDGEHAAEIIVGDLMSAVPDVLRRISKLLSAGALRPEVVPWAEQAVELLEA